MFRMWETEKIYWAMRKATHSAKPLFVGVKNLARPVLCFVAWILFVFLGFASIGSAWAGDVANAEIKKTPLRVVLFWSPTCGNCYKSKDAVKSAEVRWGGQILAESKDVSKIEFFKEMLLYEDHYSSDEEHPPKVFVGGSYIAGDAEIGKELDSVISRELARGSVTFMPGCASTPAGDSADLAERDEKVPTEILEKFHGFRVGAVALAGLVDGINPCAFTTIIFLLSMLAYLGKTQRQLAIVGVGFTAAVFLTYFILGFGVLGAIKIFSVSHGVSRGLTYVVVALTFGLAAWSFVDFVRCSRSGDVNKTTLGLPRSVKSRIHKVIREGFNKNSRGLLVGSFVIGGLVALLESLCTGQVYLPTLIFVAREPSLRSEAVAYLLLYNIAFILPLVGILVIAYFGVGSELMGRFLKQHLAIMKLALAVLFAGLGALLLSTM